MSSALEHVSQWWPYDWFRELVRVSSHRVLFPQDLEAFGLPPEASPAEAWLALCNVRYCTAIRAFYATKSQVAAWYTPTNRLLSLAHDIDALCRPEAPLSQTLLSPRGAHHLMRCQSAEIIAAATQDGFALSPDRAHDVVVLKKQPRSVEEQLVSNMVRLMDSLDSYMNAPFNSELLAHFHSAIVQNVDADLIARHPLNLLSLDDPQERSRIARRFSLTANDLWKMANDPVQGVEHPAIKAMVLRVLMSEHFDGMPFGTTLTRFAFSLYALKNGLPALALAPITESIVAWIENSPRTLSHLLFDGDGNDMDTAIANADLTAFLETALAITHDSLLDLQETIAAEESEIIAVSSAIFEAGQLNRRQYTIVNYCLHNPEAELTIRYHQKNHRIAYATARADFLDLVTKGYLRQRYRGRAMVFSLDPRMKRSAPPQNVSEAGA